jgi:hypothetical protein
LKIENRKSNELSLKSTTTSEKGKEKADETSIRVLFPPTNSLSVNWYGWFDLLGFDLLGFDL